MNIEFYEKEKRGQLFFKDLKDGEFFITEFDSESRYVTMKDAQIEIFKKLPIKGSFNCLRFESSEEKPQLTNMPDDILVYRVEIKKIVIDVDW